MTIDMYKRVKESIGYKSMMKALDIVFKGNYEISKIIPSDDYTSYDFRTIMTINNIEGVDIGVGLSGNSHQFQVGDGVIGIGIPMTDGIFRLPSGLRGETFEELADDGIPGKASANNLDDIIQLFKELKKYLEKIDS